MAKISLIDAINNANEEDLKAIDEEIITVQKRLDVLETTRKVVYVKLHGKPQKAPKGSKSPKVTVQRPVPEEMNIRDRTGHLLLDKGVMKAKFIAEALKCSEPSVYTAVNHAFFIKTSEGIALSTQGKNHYSD